MLNREIFQEKWNFFLSLQNWKRNSRSFAQFLNPKAHNDFCLSSRINLYSTHSSFKAKGLFLFARIFIGFHFSSFKEITLLPKMCSLLFVSVKIVLHFKFGSFHCDSIPISYQIHKSGDVSKYWTMRFHSEGSFLIYIWPFHNLFLSTWFVLSSIGEFTSQFQGGWLSLLFIRYGKQLSTYFIRFLFYESEILFNNFIIFNKL